MPSSVKDRFANKYENVYMLVKNKKYWFDLDAVRVPQTVGHLQKQLAPVLNKKNRWQYKKQGLHDFINPLGKNPGDLWSIPTQPCPRDFRGVHFAIFPEKLVEPMILAGTPKNGIVLDPFCGLATTCVVAKRLGRNYIGIDLSPKYVKMAEERVKNQPVPLIKL